MWFDFVLLFNREAVVRAEDGTIRGTIKVRGTLGKSSKGWYAWPSAGSTLSSRLRCHVTGSKPYQQMLLFSMGKNTITCIAS